MPSVVEQLGFSRTHRKDLMFPATIENLTDDMPDTSMLFPDLGMPGDKIETLSVSKLITGTIKSQQITLDITNGEGDIYLKGGTVDVDAWTATGGFILGLDDSDGNAEKFFIGDGTTSLDWNVTTADTLTVKGSITATSGTIGGWTIEANQLSSGNVAINGTNEQILMGLATAPLTGNGIFIGLDGSDYEFRAGDPTGAYLHWNGSGLTLNGSVITEIASGSEVAIQDWTYSGAFSVTDADTVAWATGTLTLATGETFNITGANTGNMAAFNYIYFDKATSTTAFQVSTSFSAGSGKILIATAQNGTSEASYLMMGGAGTHNLDGTTIAASSIIAGKLSVSQLSAITADLGTITAGTVTGATIQTASSGTRFKMTSTAFQGINSTGDVIYEVVLSGANAGDVIIGDDALGAYVQWDNSASKLIIAGDIINIDTSTGEIRGSLTGIYEATAGEALSENDAVYMEESAQTLIYAEQTTDDSQVDFGNDATGAGDLGQSFQVSEAHNISSVIVKVGKITSPTDSLVLTIEADVAGYPSGTPLASASILGSSLNSTPQEETFNLDATIELTAATTYWIRLSRSGADSSNRYWCRYNTAGGYGSGKFSREDAGTWTDFDSGNDDAYFKIQFVTTAGKVYKASALQSGTSDGFIGFADGAYAKDATATIQVDDVDTSHSGLTVGATYYLSDTYGAISTSAGTKRKKVGIALAATDFQMDLTDSDGAADIGNETKSNAAGTQVITHGLGKAPKQIKFLCGQTTTSQYISDGGWANGKNMCYVSTSGHNATYAMRTATGGDFLAATVTAVSDTDFTLTWVKGGIGTAAAFIWQAIT